MKIQEYVSKRGFYASAKASADSMGKGFPEV